MTTIAPQFRLTLEVIREVVLSLPPKAGTAAVIKACYARAGEPLSNREVSLADVARTIRQERDKLHGVYVVIDGNGKIQKGQVVGLREATRAARRKGKGMRPILWQRAGVDHPEVNVAAWLEAGLDEATAFELLGRRFPILKSEPPHEWAAWRRECIRWAQRQLARPSTYPYS